MSDTRTYQQALSRQRWERDMTDNVVIKILRLSDCYLLITRGGDSCRMNLDWRFI